MSEKLKRETVEWSVVGLQYRLTASTRKYLHDYVMTQGPIDCRLQREPKNPKDENAVMVILASSPYKGMHIGYLRREVAEVVSPALRENVMRDIRVWLADINADKSEGLLSVKFKRVVSVKKMGVKKPVSKRKTAKSKNSLDKGGKRR